jgi:Carbohydrate esterase, sialic acid-specific acetylesterase
MLLDVSYRDGIKEETAKAYGDNLVRWVESTRRELGNKDLPIVMNRAIPSGAGAPYLEVVRKAQDAVKLPQFRLEMGKRFARVMIELTKASK